MIPGFPPKLTSIDQPEECRKARKAPAWYAWSLVAIPLLATPLLVLLGKSDFFLHHGASVWVQANDSVFDAKGRDCKVLIFGDSTAMTGIDPSLVQQRTGLPTCNISVTNAVLSVTDRLSLNSFLAHNTRPEVLVVQLSPEGFQKTSATWKDTVYPEGMVELLRHTPPSNWRPLLLRHPQQAFTFAGYVAGFSAWYGIRQAVSHTTGIGFEDDRLVVQNGFFTPPAPARTRCEPVPEETRSDTATMARRTVADYSGSANTGSVLVDVAPIPSCDENLVRYQRELDGITANRLQALPIHYFNDERHFTASGSRVLSYLVADQVNSAIHGPGAYPPATSNARQTARETPYSGSSIQPAVTQ